VPPAGSTTAHLRLRPRGADPLRFDKFRFDNQPTQFLQEAVRFTVVVAVVEALVTVVAFVLASR